MADIETTLTTTLGSVARTYPLFIPDNAPNTYPKIVYQRISTQEKRVHGASGQDKIRFQISIYGTTYDSVKAAVSSIITAMKSAGFNSTRENQFDIKEISTNLFRVVMEYFVWDRG